MIEESPCPVISEKVRQELCASAILIIKHANYVNAATVEFLLDKDKHFYFIEVNTRIQVEHPVSEMVTGRDLIKMQLQVAAGEKLAELTPRSVGLDELPYSQFGIFAPSVPYCAIVVCESTLS